MTYARLRKLLSIATGVCLSVGLAILTAMLVIPLNEPEQKIVNTKPNANLQGQPIEPSKDWSESQFGELLTRRLQRPVIDPPAAQKDVVENRQPVPQPQPPQIQLELIGTAIDSDQQASHAWVKVNGQSERLVKPGDLLEGLQPPTSVKLIESKRIVVTTGVFDLEFKFN